MDKRQLLSRQGFPYGLLGLAMAWWGMLAGVVWCAAKAVLLAFAHTYANLDFPAVVPWLVLGQVVCYAGVLWYLRQTFRLDRKPHAMSVYAAIFLTLSTTLSCFGILAHNATRDALPMQAQMPMGGPVGDRFAAPGIFAGIAPATPPSTTVEEGREKAEPQAIPARPHVASGPFLRRLGFFCRNLSDNGFRLKLLIALLILPLGLLINRDMLRSHFEPVEPEGKLMVAMAWIVAMAPALLFGWLYGFLVAWCVWAGLGNLAAIVAYRVALREPAPDVPAA